MITYTVERCQQIGGYPRHYGYTIRQNPPQMIKLDGYDVEGVGWVVFPTPRIKFVRFKGWYKFRSDAVRRCVELNRGAK